MFSSCVRIVPPVLRRSSSSSTNVRKSTDIRLLFKKIHPDLFATRSHDVQQTNLKCMQAIQELNNQIQYTIELVGSHQKNYRSGDSQVLIGYPRSFHPVYRLSCYVHRAPAPGNDDQSSSDDGPKDDLSFISVNIITPPILRKNQITDLGTFNAALRTFLGSLAKFWTSMNLPYPYEEYVVLQGADDEGGAENLTASLTDKGFAEEFGISKDEFVHEAFSAALRRKYMTASANPLMTGSVKQFSRTGRSLQFKKMTKNRANEVDAYFRKNLHVANISLDDELGVIQKFRTFLLDFGESVNFSFESWMGVHVVLFKDEGRRPATALYEVKTVNHGKSFIVRVPVHFKPSTLIDFLHENVPCSLIDIQ